jgi:hypothetical protein
VSGLLDTWVMAGLMWAVCGHLGGALTTWMGSLGGLWGWAACGLAPFGALEILLALGARDSGRADDVRWLARMQVAALLIGGVSTAMVGWWVLRNVPAERGVT